MASEEMWENGEPTDYGIEVYTEGDCWALAWALHEITGLPVVLAGTRETWQHVFVHAGRNKYLDITGFNTRKEAVGWSYDNTLVWLKKYEMESVDTYLDAIEWDNFLYLGEWDEARGMAGLIRAKYLAQ